ncbi:MAG: hypothetical protein H6Q43_3616, partial [Deltaproteobacteria bacterium]|nr:hypothetical protein [Deltaproteobacteria bacterium]
MKEGKREVIFKELAEGVVQYDDERV